MGTAIIAVFVCVREAFLEEATSQLGTKDKWNLTSPQGGESSAQTGQLYKGPSELGTGASV